MPTFSIVTTRCLLVRCDTHCQQSFFFTVGSQLTFRLSIAGVASKNGRTIIAGTLLEHGAQIHGQETKYGNTALHVRDIDIALTLFFASEAHTSNIEIFF
jgi:hypothetical protein